MALTVVNYFLGPKSTPHEVKDLRRSTFDYHSTYGMPVVHKHRWNERDVKNGLAIHCPYHFSDVYEQGWADCPYCFGTGYLGGFADGVIVWVTFSDATENRIRVGPNGVLMFDREPQMVAPWIPDMGNSDLIITADFEPDTFDIVEERDRYTMKEVTPVTVRGFQRQVQTKEFRVQQNSQIDRVPDGDIFYQVPIVFDYGNLPPLPPDPDHPGTTTSTTIGLRIQGEPYLGQSQVLVPLRINGLGSTGTSTHDIRVWGDPSDSDVVIIWETD